MEHSYCEIEMMKYRTQDDDSSRVIHTVLRITLSSSPVIKKNFK